MPTEHHTETFVIGAASDSCYLCGSFGGKSRGGFLKFAAFIGLTLTLLRMR